MTETKKAIEELSFREAMAELEEIVGVLETNTLELEESLSRYERGVALLTALRTRLNGAQQKVETLMGELDVGLADAEKDRTLS